MSLRTKIAVSTYQVQVTNLSTVREEDVLGRRLIYHKVLRSGMNNFSVLDSKLHPPLTLLIPKICNQSQM